MILVMVFGAAKPSNVKGEANELWESEGNR